MLAEDPQRLFDEFAPLARAYIKAPGVMKALELDKVCMKLYPVVARKLEDLTLANRIREFGRNLPRKEADELAVLLEEIFAGARQAGLAVSP